MSDPTWDWWFGDGPARVARHLEMGVTSRRHRRCWIAAVITGTGLSFIAGLASLKAEEPLTIKSNPVRVAAVAFAMLEEDDETDGGNDSLPEPSKEDQLRRQRLRELLEDRPSEADSSSRTDEARRDRLKELLQDRSDLEKNDVNKPKSPNTSSQFSEPFLKERLPDVIDGAFVLPSLQAVSTATQPIGNGRLPDDFAADEELRLQPLPEDAYSRGLLAAGTLLPWAAPNTYSHPLYFEDQMLERHGHERWGCMQPIAAGARFFTTIPMLPYLATIQEPCDIVYSKGYYRAGSPAPLLYQRPPMDRRAVVVEAAAISGAFIALP